MGWHVWICGWQDEAKGEDVGSGEDGGQEGVGDREMTAHKKLRFFPSYFSMGVSMRANSR
jgi:hypothetical protein